MVRALVAEGEPRFRHASALEMCLAAPAPSPTRREEQNDLFASFSEPRRQLPKLKVPKRGSFQASRHLCKDKGKILCPGWTDPIFKWSDTRGAIPHSQRVRPRGLIHLNPMLSRRAGGEGRENKMQRAPSVIVIKSRRTHVNRQILSSRTGRPPPARPASRRRRVSTAELQG